MTVRCLPAGSHTCAYNSCVYLYIDISIYVSVTASARTCCTDSCGRVFAFGGTLPMQLGTPGGGARVSRQVMGTPPHAQPTGKPRWVSTRSTRCACSEYPAVSTPSTPGPTEYLWGTPERSLGAPVWGTPVSTPVSSPQSTRRSESPQSAEYP